MENHLKVSFIPHLIFSKSPNNEDIHLDIQANTQSPKDLYVYLSNSYIKFIRHTAGFFYVGVLDNLMDNFEKAARCGFFI
ncbi:hypothetical protein CC99x_005375 [Candidatus Berkiella cookevillensis]|uniref:Uncharacterized protein n=1 Tax=Candidatus Berkiella cookevillensis TaxID=437022 RepID=A0A0Q9YRM4_9GAMM|nr:hypothetical protein [Candidatus Berkiella cookevillensis]MCS5708332.1 hypothetical protein [Candidatus Berkiella cookevillensis]